MNNATNRIKEVTNQASRLGFESPQEKLKNAMEKMARLHNIPMEKVGNGSGKGSTRSSGTSFSRRVEAITNKEKVGNGSEKGSTRSSGTSFSRRVEAITNKAELLGFSPPSIGGKLVESKEVAKKKPTGVGIKMGG